MVAGQETVQPLFYQCRAEDFKLLLEEKIMKITVAEIDSVGNDIEYDVLDKLGDVTFYKDKITEENVVDRAGEAEVLVINKSKITSNLLLKMPNVRLICEFATGFDNVDLAACSSRNVKVANVVGYSTASVAQHTFALYLYLSESLRHYDEFVKNGEYGAQEHFSCLDLPFDELDGMKWGIVGMGNIGKRTAKIAEAFGAHVIFYASSGKSSCTEYEQVSFDELLMQSDVISLHCPLSDRTKNLMDMSAFKKMKKTAYLINVARGPVVNEEDLYEALESGEIKGAGLDVLSAEPISKDNPLGRLKDSNKIIITPHMAWGSTKARTTCVNEVAENIKAYEKGLQRNIVNG